MRRGESGESTHLIEIRNFSDIHKVYHREILNFLRNTIQRLVHRHTIFIVIVSESYTDYAIFFYHYCLGVSLVPVLSPSCPAVVSISCLVYVSTTSLLHLVYPYPHMRVLEVVRHGVHMGQESRMKRIWGYGCMGV